MKIKGSVEDISILFKVTKFGESTHFLSQENGVLIKAMDASRASMVSVFIPMGYTAISLEDVPDGNHTVFAPNKEILDPLAYFDPAESVSLSFTKDGIILKVANFERIIKYHEEKDAVPVPPTLSLDNMQKVIVDAEDIKRAINLTKDPADFVTFYVSKSGLSVKSESMVAGIHSNFKIAPEQTTLFGVNKTVVSDFDPKLLLNVLPYAKGEIELMVGENYPMSFSGILKNDLHFTNLTAPRMRNSPNAVKENDAP